MKVFLAGATGVMGRHLVPRLVERGHAVVGMTRSPEKAELIRSLGAEPAIADALNPEQVARAVGEAEPEAIVHQLTALPASIDPRRIDRDFAPTNRLRSEGTDHLLAAARAVGARRFLAQSFAGWPYAQSGGPVKSEEDPLGPAPAAQLRTTLDAIVHLEEAVGRAEEIDGLVLRYGNFYGPGTTFGLEPLGEQVEAVRKRRLPVVGNGAGVWSFVDIEDAASATVAAVEGAPAGVYNIVDDEPAAVSDWLPALADALGAMPPRHVPLWLGRLAAGEAGAVMMTEVRGASNAKAKRQLDWKLRFPSWRQGFAEGLG
jgi:nucleoside-diphosphate-sugar epimerase